MPPPLPGRQVRWLQRSHHRRQRLAALLLWLAHVAAAHRRHPSLTGVGGSFVEFGRSSRGRIALLKEGAS